MKVEDDAERDGPCWTTHCGAFCFWSGVAFCVFKSMPGVLHMLPCSFHPPRPISELHPVRPAVQLPPTTELGTTTELATSMPSTTASTAARAGTTRGGLPVLAPVVVPARCDAHWTWAGAPGFWQPERSPERSPERISFRITRGQKNTRPVTAHWSRQTPHCGKGPRRPGCVVVVGAKDRFAGNVWHRLTAIFEAWVTPRILELLQVLPANTSVTYYVPALNAQSIQSDQGPLPWHLLGPLTSTDCGFQHHVVAPIDGFLWDLAWDLPLNCAVSSNLWNDFQKAFSLMNPCHSKPGAF